MKRILAVVCLLSMQVAATAAEGPHPWIVPAPRLVKETYFSNLQDGASIETPFLLKFGLTGVGIATINGVAGGTGHHHLLVNRELPLDFTKPLKTFVLFAPVSMEGVPAGNL